MQELLRRLTDEEYTQINMNNIIMVLGQDHEWYIYSDDINAFCGTGRTLQKVKTEEQMLELVKTEGIHRDATWNFGDEPEY